MVGEGLSLQTNGSVEARNRALFECVPDALFVIGSDGRIFDVNQAAIDQHGYSREELLAMHVDDLSAPDGAGNAQQSLRRAFELAAPFEWRSRRKDGSDLHVEIRVRPFTDAGQPSVVASVRDITERKRAAHTLEVSETRYRRLFEAAKDGILILDADTGQIDDVNPFLMELLGYSYEDLLGKHVWEIGPFKNIAASKEAFVKLQMEKFVRYDDLPLKARDGRTIDVEFVSNVYRVDNQSVIQCNIRDITERKRAAAEQKSLEEQLRGAQKMEAIGSLAGGVAHDFNNLLSVILGYMELALNSVREGDPLRDDLMEVRRAGERAAVLTRQLLAFSRKQVLQPVPLSLNQVAAGLEKMLRRILGEDIDLVQELAPDLGLTLADTGQIEQVLMNLVVNARDAMPEGGKLTIETGNVELGAEYGKRHGEVAPGPYVMVAVTDSGCGMDLQTKAKLFEPFFTTKEAGKGTGLGLSTVYGIVKQSGGTIWVYSEIGKGTTFKIYLPRDYSTAKTTATNLPAVAGRRTGGETILVVEDEEALRRVTQRMLERAGYKVLTAASGDEALVTVAQHKGDIHLLLTDVVMPRMNGKVLAQALLKMRPTAKVLYVSGYADNAIIRHGVLDIGTHFLAKPFTAADLTRKVGEELDGIVTNPSVWHGQTSQAEAETAALPVDRDALGALPAEMLGTLRKAVAAARYDEIVKIVETIRITEPGVAAGLARMTEHFDYEGMRDLLGE